MPLLPERHGLLGAERGEGLCAEDVDHGETGNCARPGGLRLPHRSLPAGLGPAGCSEGGGRNRDHGVPGGDLRHGHLPERPGARRPRGPPQLLRRRLCSGSLPGSTNPQRHDGHHGVSRPRRPGHAHQGGKEGRLEVNGTPKAVTPPLLSTPRLVPEPLAACTRNLPCALFC